MSTDTDSATREIIFEDQDDEHENGVDQIDDHSTSADAKEEFMDVEQLESDCSTPTPLTINEQSNDLNDPKLMQTVQVVVEDCMTTRSTSHRPDEARGSATGDNQRNSREKDIGGPSGDKMVSPFPAGTEPRGSGISFQCYRCQKQFHEEPFCRRHMSSMCVQPFVCRICDKMFRFQSQLSRHLDYHLGERLIVCTWPESREQFDTEEELTQHKTIIDTGSVQKSNAVGSSIRGDGERRNPVHIDKKPHICPHLQCGKKFERAGKLRRHQLVHSTERSHPCEYPKCEKRFKRKAGLKAHVDRVHVVEKPYACIHPNCQSRFSSKAELRLHHMRYHTDERPYVCTYAECRKSFTSKADLQRHNNGVHSDERPYECDHPQCAKKFKTKGHLQAHKQVHSN